MKAVVYQEPYNVTVEEMPDPKIDKFDRRIDGHTKVPIKPGMAAWREN